MSAEETTKGLEFRNEGADLFLLEAFDFRQRKGDLKKLEIIRAAIHCLATQGMENTTYEAIAKLINTRRAHIAYHFNDKNQIFVAAIKYILVTYQQLATQKMGEQERMEDIIKSYVESSFDWAKEYPEQVSVMLLLYYLCGLDKQYIELNHEVREAGLVRLKKVLSKKFSDDKKCEFVARSIQNIMSSALVDSHTTKNMSLQEACDNALDLINGLIK